MEERARILIFNTLKSRAFRIYKNAEFYNILINEYAFSKSEPYCTGSCGVTHIKLEYLMTDWELITECRDTMLKIQIMFHLIENSLN